MVTMKEDVEEMKKAVEEVQKEEKTLAMSLLQDMKRTNKRLFLLCVLEFLGLLLSISYTIYVLNDVGTVTTEITQENTDGYNNYIGNDGDITNGETEN